jgi:pyruvate formate lyase activating enzyme
MPKTQVLDQLDPRYVREGLLQEPLEGGKVQCLTCEQRCTISPGHVGFCSTRYNDNGTIKTIVYGCIASAAANPIEKKPLFHFHPATNVFTVGSFGCNFSCPWCQNHDISHPGGDLAALINATKFGSYMSPEDLIRQTKATHCQGTSISFNEPTLELEYSIDVFKLARQQGLYNTYVTNGYMTPEALDLLVEAGLDAMAINIKGSPEMVRRYCKADLEPTWQNAKRAKELGIHVEIITLVIEPLNSDEDTLSAIATRVRDDLGDDTPYHVTRFFPEYKSEEIGLTKPTSVAALEAATKFARDAGLKFVYTGNLPGNDNETTRCPSCGQVAIKRFGYEVDIRGVDDQGRCTNCQADLNIKI